MQHTTTSSQELAAAITRNASKQTYYTVRFLVDRDLIPDAYRAYAYFRWVDDHIDQDLANSSDRVDFINRQGRLIDSCYQGAQPRDINPQEQLVVDLIRGNLADSAGLQTYIREMLAVMAFDARRKQRLIPQSELDDYVLHLATAVTEALHTFIGHCCPTPQSEARYRSAAGAHITHMLRDTFEDNQGGYFNIPSEYLEAHGITPYQLSSPAYRAWVKSRVHLARQCFSEGKGYLAQVENFRCRLAGYAYIARFEGILGRLEREEYLVRPDYREFKSTASVLKIFWSALRQALRKPENEMELAAPGGSIPAPN
jgi:phytoene/squalene synthetase